MKKKSLLFFLSLLLVLTATGCKASVNKAKERDAGRQLLSEDWKVRESGIHILANIEDNNYKINKDTQDVLINLIKNETQTFNNFQGELRSTGKSDNQIYHETYNRFPPQTYGDYIKALVYFTASKNIGESLPAIFQLIADTDYNITPAILTMYGKTHLDFFIEKASVGAIKERKIAMSALGVLADPSIESDDFDMSLTPQLSGLEKEKIRLVLMKAAKDADANIRSLSLFGLRAFMAEPDVRKLISEIAISDKDEGVRDDARRLLNRN
ncbi:MAG: hypothetical protein V2A66_08795 [Pseudomonadota bacterium]